MASNTTVSTATVSVSKPRPFTGESVRRLMASETRKRVERATACGVKEPEKDGLRRATLFVAGIVLRDHAEAKNLSNLVGAILLFLTETFKGRGMEQKDAEARAILCMAEVEEALAPKPKAEAKPEAPKPTPKPAPARPKFTVERVRELMVRSSDVEGVARWLMGKIRPDSRYTPQERGALESEVRVCLTTMLAKKGLAIEEAQQTAEQATAAPKPRRMRSADERRRPAPRPASAPNATA